MNNNKFLVTLMVILLAALLSSCSPPLPTPNPLLTTPTMSQEKIKFQTTDNVTIVGNWNSVTGAAKAALLLHMMPATKESYEPLAAELNKSGFSTLAVDLRGHGESTVQGEKKLDHKTFSDAQQQSKRLDVDAAMNFLKGKGFSDENIVMVGASIGANLVVDAMYRYNQVTRGVLLSPGLDYRGVKTENAIKQLLPTQKVWIFSSKGDSYSADSTMALGKINTASVVTKICEGSEHGTNMFESDTTLIQDIIKFLSEP